MDITAEEVRSLENMDAEDGGVGEGGDVVRVVDGGAGDAIVMGGDDRGRGDRGRGLQWRIQGGGKPGLCPP